jgi:hypothetical protein
MPAVKRPLPVRRTPELTDAGEALSTEGGDALYAVLSGVGEMGALADGRAAHSISDLLANLSGSEVKLGEGAAEGIAMHAEFIGSLALIALVVRENLKDVAALKLANGIGVGNARGVHLRNETVKFALQVCLAARLRFFSTTSL